MTNEQYRLLELAIAKLQNENYASPEARILMDLENELILTDYYGEVVDAVSIEDNLWLDE